MVVCLCLSLCVALKIDRWTEFTYGGLHLRSQLHFGVPKKNLENKGDFVEQPPPAKCLPEGGCDQKTFSRATVRRLQNHPSSLFLLDRRAKPHARGEDIKGLTMGAEAIDLFKTTAAKRWRGTKICGVSVHLCIFHRLIRSDGQWVNTVSRSYLLLLRTQT